VFPAEFILVAAMNPCPCGYYPDMNRCVCTPADIKRYQNRISFPILDRIDLCVEVSAVSYEELQKKHIGTVNSYQMRKQVERARKIQKKRYENEEFLFNSELPTGKLDQYCPMTASAKKLLENAYGKMHLSARAYHRIIRIARTIADLDEAKIIDVSHISEAVYYRGIERRSSNEWG